MSWNSWSMFSSRSSMVSRLPLKSFIQFEFISVFRVRQWSSLMLCCHIFPAPHIEETSLSPWCTLASYVKKFKVLLIFLLSTSILLNRLYIPLHLILRECYDIFLNIPFFLKRQMNTPEVNRISWGNIEIRLGLCSGLSYLKDPVSFSRLITTLPTWQLDILSQKPGDIALSHTGIFNYHFLRIFKSLAHLL